MRRFERRENSKPKKVKWRIPTEDGDYKKVPIGKMPTYFIICLLGKFAKKGYSKIRGLVNNEDAWMLQYITELETELDKRDDVDEYI